MNDEGPLFGASKVIRIEVDTPIEYNVISKPEFDASFLRALVGKSKFSMTVPLDDHFKDLLEPTYCLVLGKSDDSARFLHGLRLTKIDKEKGEVTFEK